MTAWAYYNEIDPHAAQWLRNLMQAGLIAPGFVDERSIEDVCADDLSGFSQHHWFCGIGTWSYCLRQAGWPDDRPVFTGSPPCQPFSAAGRRKGAADPRHLWPALYWLLRQHRPGVIFGEQVASKDALAWLDTVQSDMEAAGYAFAALDLCAAGFGAPHIRQRLLFVGQSVEHHQGDGRIERGAESGEWSPERGCGAVGMADDESLGWLRGPHDGDGGRRECAFGSGSEAERLANSNGWDPGAERRQRGGEQRQQQENSFLGALGSGGRPCPVNGFWRAADWLFCTDGKWRPAQPGTQPLVDGASFKLGSGGAFEGKSRIKMLKGYGGAIVAPQATEFIKAAMEFLK